MGATGCQFAVAAWCARELAAERSHMGATGCQFADLVEAGEAE